MFYSNPNRSKQVLDLTTIIGFATSLIAIIGAHLLHGGRCRDLIQWSACLFVIAGMIGAVAVSATFCNIRVALKALPLVFTSLRNDRVRTSTLVNTQSVIAGDAENYEWSANQNKDILVGEISPKLLRSINDFGLSFAIRQGMRDILVAQKQAEYVAALYETAAGLAPTFGILGSIVGLMRTMKSLHNPSELGASIAAAFVSTIYGLALANLILLPIAGKVRAKLLSRCDSERYLLAQLELIQLRRVRRVSSDRRASSYSHNSIFL